MQQLRKGKPDGSRWRFLVNDVDDRMKTLIVTAVAAERDAILAALPAATTGVTVLAGGVGPAAAAATAAARSPAPTW